MQDASEATIVPSTRDLLQVLSTRRHNLAVIGLVGAESPAEEAARLFDLNASAFACAEPSPSMALAAGATKTVPMLCLAPATEREHLLAARAHGADGVCLDATMPQADWDRLARIARTMRMVPVALATETAGVECAFKAGARALLVHSPTVEALLELARTVPRTITVVGLVDGADAAAIRALAGKIDAAVVPSSVHQAASFAELVAEVDP